MQTMQKLKKWGNSQGVIISAKQCEMLGWKIDDPIQMRITCDTEQESVPKLELFVPEKKKRIGVLKNFSIPSEQEDARMDDQIAAMFAQGGE